MLQITSRINYRLSFYTLINAILNLIFRKNKNDNPLSIFFENSSILYTDSARTGLFLALRSINLPKGAKIGVMTLNCHSVFNAIYQAGYTPVFLDINDDFTLSIKDFESKKDIQAIIVSHLFGRVSDIDFIRKNYPNIIIIEDCAHSFMSEFCSGELSGSKGDISVFSFNFGKFPILGSGGALVVNNKEFIDSIKNQFCKLNGYSLLGEIKLILQKIVMMFIHIPLIYGAFFLRFKKGRKNKSAIDRVSPKKISRIDFSILSLAFLQITSKLAKQKENARRITELSDFSYDAKCNNIMIPLLFNDRDRVIDNALKMGIEIGPHFSKAISWAMEFGYIKGCSPNTEVVVGQIITMPCYSELSIKEIDKLSVIFKNIN